MSEQVTTENLLDLAAYIKKATELGVVEKETILIHALHDIEGFLTPNNSSKKLFWLPRTGGWNKELK